MTNRFGWGRRFEDAPREPDSEILNLQTGIRDKVGDGGAAILKARARVRPGRIPQQTMVKEIKAILSENSAMMVPGDRE